MRLFFKLLNLGLTPYFNPRTPYGMRLPVLFLFAIFLIFQSTHPLRDATSGAIETLRSIRISIHAPLTGCDGVCKNGNSISIISIHAPLTGCDTTLYFPSRLFPYFNPRTPYGMRRDMSHRHILLHKFQSTHPLRDATLPILPNIGIKLSFQSTHPLRDATILCFWQTYQRQISIHAPLTGCDWARGSTGMRLIISIHAPLTGCDSLSIILYMEYANFNPRTPYGMRREPVLVTYPQYHISIHAPLTGCDLTCYKANLPK